MQGWLGAIQSFHLLQLVASNEETHLNPPTAKTTGGAGQLPVVAFKRERGRERGLLGTVGAHQAPGSSG